MMDDEHAHRREAYGVRESSTSRGASLCEGSMSRREGTCMASDRTITTGAATSASAHGATSSAPARGAPPASHNQCLKRAALYARVSTEKQEREETVASQVDQLYQTAAAHGYDVAPGSVFIDDGVSGTRLDRPALERLRDLVAEGAFEVVLVTAPDRLARLGKSRGSLTSIRLR
jgi:Resolvase, N terminal domain